jgi:hypothetical protein
MSEYTSNPVDLPAQAIPESKKTTEWGKTCVRAIANKGNGSGDFHSRMSREDMQENYDLVNGKFNPKKVQHVINPTNNPDLARLGGMPAKFQHYDIIASKLNELLGEEINHPFNWRAYGISGGVLSRQKQKEDQLLLQGLQNILLEEMGQEADPAAVPLDKVQEFFKTKYVDPAEKGVNQILKALVPKLGLQRMFNKGFSHVLPVAEEIYNVSTVNGEPNARACNPPFCTYDLNPDLDFIEDGQYFREERHMTVGAVIDEFREYLDKEDVKKIDARREGRSYSIAQQLGYVYPMGTDEDNKQDFYLSGISPGDGQFGAGTGNLVRVVQVCWVSLREIGFLHYPDESGNMQQQLIDPQQIKLTPEDKAKGAFIEKQWIKDIWEGTLIGEDIFCKVQPLPNQTGKLPYIGYVYSRNNSRATSLVDRVKPLQYLYNVIWYRLENELAKAHGKVVPVDLAGIPRTGEWAMTTDEWLYYKDVVGIMFYDSSQEGNENPAMARNLQIANSSIDQGLSSNIGQYAIIAKEIKEMVGDIIGVSRQREGNVTSNETKGGIESSIQQSSNITEPIFYYHNLVKQNVLTQLVEVAKLCYADGTHGQYIIDDVTREWINIDGGLLNDSSYEVYIRDSSKDAAMIQKMEMLADRMFQTGEVRASTILQMLDTDSISEKKANLLQSEDAKDARDQAAQQQQADMQTQALQAKQLEVQQGREYEAMQNQLDRDNDIRKAYISATKGAQGDANMNGSPDGLDFIKATNEQGKMNLATLKAQTDTTLKQMAVQQKAVADQQKADASMKDLLFKQQQHNDNTLLKAEQLKQKQQEMELKLKMFQAEQNANALEQKQQNQHHADKIKTDKALLALKAQEVKAKIKQANKPTPKKK